MKCTQEEAVDRKYDGNSMQRGIKNFYVLVFVKTFSIGINNPFHTLHKKIQWNDLETE